MTKPEHRIALAAGSVDHRFLAQNIRETPGFQLVAVLVPGHDPEAAPLSDCATFTSDAPDTWRAFLGRERVDLVEVSAAFPQKTQLVAHCAALNLPLLFHAPLAGRLDAALELLSCLERSDTPALVFDSLLSHPFVLKAKQAIAAGEIGELQEIRVKCHLGANAEPPDFSDPFASGALNKLALIEFLAGPIREVFGFGTARALMCALRVDGPDRYGVLELVHSEHSPIATDGPEGADHRIELTGTDGILWLENLTSLMMESPRYRLKRKATTFIEDESVSYRPAGLTSLARRQAVERLISKSLPKKALADSLHIVHIAEAILTSLQTGAPTRVPENTAR